MTINNNHANLVQAMLKEAKSTLSKLFHPLSTSALAGLLLVNLTKVTSNANPDKPWSVLDKLLIIPLGYLFYDIPYFKITKSLLFKAHDNYHQRASDQIDPDHPLDYAGKQNPQTENITGA